MEMCCRAMCIFLTNMSENHVNFVASLTVVYYFVFQTVSHLKVALHLLVGIFIGLLYSDCGTDASKSIYNVGFLIVSLVYLSYTSLMPAILKCKYQNVVCCIV